MTQSESSQLYFAGALFHLRELLGNRILADAIERCSKGAFRCFLPQHFEQTSARALTVRNQDLLAVLRSDLAIFQFDGAELDSGTVVEFMVAKMIDLPSVVIRTDLRAGGDQCEGNDPWNLMCSNYPRTSTVILNGMEEYQQGVREVSDGRMLVERVAERCAARIVAAAHGVQKTRSLFHGDPSRAHVAIQWVIDALGGGMGAAHPGLAEEIIRRRQARGDL